MNEVEIKGLQELYVALSTTIPRKMEGRVLQKALAAGAAVITKQAKANIRDGASADFVGPPVPYPLSRTGTLKRAIYSARGKTSTPEKEVRIINVRRGGRAAKKGRDAYYGRMVEFGHRVSKGGRLIRESRATTKKGFDKYERKRAAGLIKGERSTEFVPPKPFMRPAFDARKNEATQRTVDKLRELIYGAVQESRF